MSKPKILRIINRFNLGGPTFNAAYLTKYLENDFETLLVGGQKDESEASSEFIVEKLGLHPRLLNSMRRKINFFNDLSSYRELKKIIKEFKPDIVHTHASKAGAVGRLAAYHCNVPVIVHTFHGNVFKGYFGSFKTSLVKKTERYLAKRSTAIIAISDLQKKELVEEHHICESNKITVIPLGFDLTRFHENQEEKRKQFRNRFEIKEDEIAIGIIGRLVPIKNHKLFIRSISELKQKTSKKIRAFIIGDGECMQELQNFCSEINLEFDFPEKGNLKMLKFTSWIKEIDVANAGLDIIALTSDNEGTPVSLIEAQSSSKAIVSTRVGGIENVVSEGKTALLSEKGDLDGFLTNLTQLVENEELRKTFGAFGRTLVEHRFHYTRLVEDTKNLYNRLLKPSDSQ